MSSADFVQPVVRDRGAARDAVRERDHRHVPLAADAGLGLHPAAPLHGRGRRRVPRVGTARRRDRRDLARDRRGGRGSSARSCAPRRPWQRITTSGGRATGVVLESGEEIRPRAVVSSADVADDAGHAARARHAVRRGRRRGARRTSSADRRARSTSPSTGCRLSAALPAGTRTSTAGWSPSRPRSTISSGPTTTRSTADFRARRTSIWASRSAIDPSVAPPGKHVMACFVQYAPYELADRNLGRPARSIRRHGPSDDRAIRARPARLSCSIARRSRRSTSSARFGLTEGNIFQGELLLEQLFSGRPMLGAGYATPVRDLWLCGSSTHPGGAISGAPGPQRCRRGAARAARPARATRRGGGSRVSYDAIVIGAGHNGLDVCRVPGPRRAARARRRGARSVGGMAELAHSRSAACRRSWLASWVCAATDCASSSPTCARSRRSPTVARSRCGATSTALRGSWPTIRSRASAMPRRTRRPTRELRSLARCAGADPAARSARSAAASLGATVRSVAGAARLDPAAAALHAHGRARPGRGVVRHRTRCARRSRRAACSTRRSGRARRARRACC